MGEQIKKGRLARGLTTTQLAYRIGVGQSSVVRLEQSEKRGAISLAHLQKAASALGFELVYSFRPLSTANLTRRSGSIGQEVKKDKLRLAQKRKGADRLKQALELSSFLAVTKRKGIGSV